MSFVFLVKVLAVALLLWAAWDVIAPAFQNPNADVDDLLAKRRDEARKGLRDV